MNNKYFRNTASIILVAFCFNSTAFAVNHASLSTNAVIIPKPCNLVIDQSQFNFTDISTKTTWLDFGKIRKTFSLTADGCEGMYLTAESSRFSGENNNIALPSSPQDDNVGLGVTMFLVRYGDNAAPSFKKEMSFDGISRFPLISQSNRHYKGSISIVLMNMLRSPRTGQINTNIMFTVHYS